MADGKRVTIAVKVSEQTAAMIDGARGKLTRSAWLQSAIKVALNEESRREALAAVTIRRRTENRRLMQDPGSPGLCPYGGEPDAPEKPAAPCTRRGLRPGAYCKTCGSTVPERAKRN